MPKSVYTQAYKLLLQELVDCRHASGLTQQELADKLGKPQSFISKFERGERRLDVIEFLDIARILGADATSILKEVSGALQDGAPRRRRK